MKPLSQKLKEHRQTILDYLDTVDGSMTSSKNKMTAIQLAEKLKDAKNALENYQSLYSQY